MRKIIIKLPRDKSDVFRVQRKGWKGRRFKNGTGAINRLERIFPRTEFKERLSIIVKEWDGRRYRNINETLVSKDPKYLLYTAGCFLEKYLSKGKRKQLVDRYCEGGD